MDAPPLSDDYLRSVTIGERTPLNGTVFLAPYSSAWPRDYQLLASRIRKALGEAICRLEHVGSTSVPGLSAKPVIDIVLTVSDSADEPSYIPHLEKQGFVLRCREPDWYQHRFLKTPEIEGNLHVFSDGCPEVDRMVDFRDRLRTNRADRERYSREKSRLAAQVWSDVAYYAEAKSDIVDAILSGM